MCIAINSLVPPRFSFNSSWLWQELLQVQQNCSWVESQFWSFTGFPGSRWASTSPHLLLYLSQRFVQTQPLSQTKPVPSAEPIPLFDSLFVICRCWVWLCEEQQSSLSPVSPLPGSTESLISARTLSTNCCSSPPPLSANPARFWKGLWAVRAVLWSWGHPGEQEALDFSWLLCNKGSQSPPSAQSSLSKQLWDWPDFPPGRQESGRLEPRYQKMMTAPTASWATGEKLRFSCSKVFTSKRPFPFT